MQNAKKAHNSIQGHYHQKFEISYFGDGQLLRWAMTVGCLIDHKAPAFRYAKGAKPVIGCGVILSQAGNYLVISDLHIPYQHQDALEFLWAVKGRYQCKHILNVGDIVDHHAGSYHESEPDALSAEEEYMEAKKILKKYKQAFPRMEITTGNHDLIPTRKLKTAGLPMTMLDDFNKLYNLGAGWNWHNNEYQFDTKGGTPLLIPMRLNKRGRWDKTL